MIDVDKWQEILASLKANKLRTFLTAFGVFWGILMLILLLGMGKGFENGQSRWLGSDDPNSLWITGAKTAVPWQGLKANRVIDFHVDDLDILKRQVSDIATISAENRAAQSWWDTEAIVYGTKTINFAVMGVDEKFFDIKRFLEVRQGRLFHALDLEQRRKVALLGTKVVESLFGKNVDPIGKRITVNGVSLRVVGVFYDSGRQGRMSERVYIPLTTFAAIYGNENGLNTIAVMPKAGVDYKVFENQIVAALKKIHSIAPHDVRALRISNVAESSAEMQDFSSALRMFIWFVGLGTLVAGIVGISNIMIITVKERTREIGVRKALGATPASILSMILTEAVLITAIAGYIGLILGIGILELANIAVESAGGNIGGIQRPEISLQTAFLSLGILVVSGTFAGLAPALRAARILPIEAMREE